MAYNPTIYENDNPPAINSTNLNKSEQGIYNAHELIADLTEDISDGNGNVILSKDLKTEIAKINNNIYNIGSFEDISEKIADGTQSKTGWQETANGYSLSFFYDIRNMLYIIPNFEFDTFDGHYGIVFYSSAYNGQGVGAIANFSAGDFIPVPSTAKYVRFSYPSNITAKYAKVATTVKEDVQQLEGYVDELSESSDTLDKMLISNLIDSSKIQMNKYVAPGTSTYETNSSYQATDYIKVVEGITYYFYRGSNQVAQNARFVACFDKNKNALANKGGNYINNYTVEENVAYVILTFPKSNTYLSAINLSQVTEYWPYGKIQISKNYLPASSNEEVCNGYLPSDIYCAVGRTIELYNNQVFLEAEEYHCNWRCTVGKNLKRKFSITGTEALIGTYTLAFEVYNDSMELIWSASTTLHIVAAGVSSAKAICPIGDSLTNNKRWLPEMINLSGGDLSFVGIYSNGNYDSEGTMRSFKHEGRSGFSAADYINGSPYTFGGATETPHNVFWNNSASRFDWNYYKTNQNINPDVVMIWLGTNGIALDNTTNVANIKQMVDYIRQDDSSIPIFVVNTIYRGNQDGIGVQQSNDGYASQVGVWKFKEDMKVLDLMQKLDAAFATGYTNVYMINLGLTHDSEYNYGAVVTPVNPRASQTEEMPTESVHPQPQGFYQIADYMYSVISAIL